MAYVTEREWKERRWTPGSGATQVFVVTDVPDEAAAKGACPIQPGARFHLDPRLIADEPEVSREGPQVYIVSFTFSNPSGDTGDTGGLQPPVYGLKFSETTEPVDTDADGNPIRNSNGDAFSTGPSRSYTLIHYTYRRWEPMPFSGAMALAYMNTTNSDRFDLPGFGYVEPGQALCKLIAPAEDITAASLSLPVEYRFELRADGFRSRTLDAGRMATDTDNSGSVAIYDAAGNPVGDDVLLDGRGAPLYLHGYKPGADGAADAFGHRDPPQGALVERTQYAVWLRYKLYPERPFAALSLLP